MNASLRLHTLLAVACGISLAACSGSSKDAKSSSQVAVKVNGTEVSVHQFNEQLARLGAVPSNAQDSAKSQTLNGLIDQQLLVQKATESKLERDPEVLAALEQSRAQVLASAYLQRAVAPKAKPSEQAVSDYYAKNPTLFSQRRVFRLQEISTDLPANRSDELKLVVASAKSMTEVAAWLQKNRFQVMANSAVRGSEQLPMRQLASISAMKDGEMGVFTAEGKTSVLQVLASQLQPLDQAKAVPLIEQFLTVQKRDELAKAELARLRETAKIEYVGEFASLAVDKLPNAGLAPANANANAATPTSPAAPEVPGTGASAAATAVDKGMSGLR